MFDANEINQYILLPVVAMCFLSGYIIKNYTKMENQKIPLIMIIAGVVFNIILSFINKDTLTLSTFITGGISGLASTGFYELLTKALGITNKKE